MCVLYVYVMLLTSSPFFFDLSKAVAKAMRSSKVDKPSKVYVVTHKTSSGSVGNNSGGKVCYVLIIPIHTIIKSSCLLSFGSYFCLNVNISKKF